MIKKTRFEAVGQEFAVQIVRTYIRWIDVELENLVNMVIDLSDDVRLQAQLCTTVPYGTDAPPGSCDRSPSAHSTPGTCS